MAVKILNHLMDKDYQTISTILSDNSYNRSFTVHGGPCSGSYAMNGVTITRLYPLKNPIRKMNGIQVYTVDNEKYNMGTSVEFDLGGKNISFNLPFEDKMLMIQSRISGDRFSKQKVYEAMGNSMHKLESEFNVKGCESVFIVSDGNLKYHVEAFEIPPRDSVNILTALDREIEQETIKKDVHNFLSITEEFINSVYETLDKKFDFDIDIELNYSRNRRQDTQKQKFKLNIPKVTYDDIGGCEKAKKKLMLLKYALSEPDLFKRWGAKPPKGTLLYGPSGTGKTLLTKALANETDANLVALKSTDVFEMWYGQSGKNMNSIFEEAKNKTPSIILLDEFDSLAPHRQGAHEATGRVVTSFLENMDGLETINGVFLVASTNFKDNIDPAVLRSGRFHQIIEVSLPDEKAKKEIYRIHCNGKRIDEEIDWKILAEKSKDFSGADIEQVIQNAAIEKVQEEKYSGNANLPLIDTEYLLKCIEEFKIERGLKEGTDNYIG